jgi:hypothetical protein
MQPVSAKANLHSKLNRVAVAEAKIVYTYKKHDGITINKIDRLK